jgi:hypothetical protein
MSEIEKLLAAYAAGPQLLRAAVAGMTAEQLRSRPVPGRWSTLEVLCHLADTEALYALRMKRVIAEQEPALMAMDPDAWQRRLACHERDAEEELGQVELIRSQMGRILRTLSAADFQRRGMHTEAGPLTLETLLRRITDHLPHHVRFIEEKRRALRV